MTLSAPARTIDGPLDTFLLMGVVREAPVPLWVIGPAGAVVLANRAALTFLGYRDESDVVGGPSHELLHPCHLDGSAYPAHDCPIVRSAGASGGAVEWFLTRQGDPRRISWSTRGIDDAGTTLLSFTPTAREGARTASGSELPVPTPERSRAAVRAGLYAVMRRRFTDPLFSVSELAAEAHLSPRSLQTLFQDIGRSPASELRGLRLEHAYSMLERGSSVQGACFGSGYSDPGSFTRAFRLRFGCAPVRVRGSAGRGAGAIGGAA